MPDNEPIAASARWICQSAADRLDYRYNLGASTLRRKHARTGVIGALLEDVANSYFAGLLRALEDVFRDAGLAVLAASLDEEPDRERGIVADLVTERVDGLPTPRTSAQRTPCRPPLIVVDRRPHGLDCDFVVVDNHSGARQATNHLLHQRHQRIGFICDLLKSKPRPTDSPDTVTRKREAGLNEDPWLIVPNVRTEDDADRAIRQFLASSQRATASPSAPSEHYDPRPALPESR